MCRAIICSAKHVKTHIILVINSTRQHDKYQKANVHGIQCEITRPKKNIPAQFRSGHPPFATPHVLLS
jgi:hypothetical protein